jgi:hypothetical protein
MLILIEDKCSICVMWNLVLVHLETVLV